MFSPRPSADLVSAGSTGIGLKLSLGTTVTIEETVSGRVRIIMDGTECDAWIVRGVVESMAPGRGFEVTVENDLPVGEGFGTSASGALAAAVCIAHIAGASVQAAYLAAHTSEVRGGGGLGDIPAIVGGGEVPVRVVPGLPPSGRVDDAGFGFDGLVLAVTGGMLETGPVLSDPARSAAIRGAGDRALAEFLGDPGRDALFRVSNAFSENIGLQTPETSDAIAELRSHGYGAGMCMLGNSIYTDAPADLVADVTGAETFPCSTVPDMPGIIRKE